MNKELDEKIGQRIKLRRKLLNMSRPKLALLVGVTSQQIQKYETGVSAIKADKMLKFAIALNIDVNWFFEPVMNNVDLNHPLADIMNSEEVAELVIAYTRLNEQTKQQLRSFLTSVTKTNAIEPKEKHAKELNFVE